MASFILGVDLDGVVADHTRRFREIYAEIKGIDPESLPLERSWNFHEWGIGEEAYPHYHRVAVVEHAMFRTMPVIEGAAEALWRLSDAGVWIRVITHRLYVHWGHEKAVADTAAWLDANKIPYRDLCFLGAKPQIEADAYIDDAPHNITQLRQAGNTVIAFDQPYNRNVPGEPRARNWAEVEELVTAMVTERVGSFAAQIPGFDPGADRIARHHPSHPSTEPGTAASSPGERPGTASV